jgi:hypothetical protein
MHESSPNQSPSHPYGSQKAADAVDRATREFTHALIFTGHMIDAPERTLARFPAWAESRTREAIHAAIAGISWTQPGTTVGLAGAASGGDLLFHECCDELGIPSRIMLALPEGAFIAASVAPAGPAWVRRFYDVIANVRAHSLQLMGKEDGSLEGTTDNVWQRANLWMIEQATALAFEQALLALWDGKVGDGPGGTEHFLKVAKSSGVRVLPPIPMQALL